jgi:hypothetical protein
MEPIDGAAVSDFNGRQYTRASGYFSQREPE